MTARKLLDRMNARNVAILTLLRESATVGGPVIVATDRPLLKASHEMNLLLDCEGRIGSGQSDDAVSLKLRGALVESLPDNHQRLVIIKDPAASIYMNFNVLSSEKHVITLVELSQRHNIIKPLIIRDVQVSGYGPTFIDVVGHKLLPHTRYAALVTYRAMHMPKCREFLNSVALVHKPDESLSPMVRSFVNFSPGTPLQMPNASDLFGYMGVKSSFTYKQAPPGAGKTWSLVADAQLAYDYAIFNCFIIAPTNEVVLEICNRLGSRSIPHNVALSQEGYIKKLDARHSLSINWKMRTDQLERLEKSPTHFATSLKAFSNIFVMTVNKCLTPKYEVIGLTPTIILWDEITLSSTCTFYSVLNKNPQIMIAYGDEKQGTPYEAGSRPDSCLVLFSPINCFGVVGSSCHKLLSRHVRMRGLYGELFLKHFYDSSFDETLHHYLAVFTSFKIHSHYGSVVAMHSKKKGFEKSYMCGAGSTSVSKPMAGALNLVPYLAEKDRLDAFNTGDRVLTFRPVQGQQSDVVFINFVKPRFSKFLNNTCCLVAMSRHITQLHLLFLPDLPKAYREIADKFKYVDTLSVRVNYNTFVEHCIINFNVKHKLVDAKLTRAGLVDHNGDFFLKWWFFLALVERCVCYAGKLPYDYKYTAFASLLDRRVDAPKIKVII